MLRQIALLHQVEKTERGKKPSVRLAARRELGGSELKFSGWQCPAKASSRALMQKPASSVIGTRQISTRRVNQSTTAARCLKQRAIGFR
jgi:hypothetical protein